MSRDDSRAPYEPVLQQMLLAGWIEEYAFTSDAKIVMKWTPFGSARAWMLKGIVRSHDKHDGAHSSECSDTSTGVVAEEPSADTIHPNVAAYCDRCVRELKLSRSAGDFLVLIYVIKACPPKVESGRREEQIGSDRLQLEFQPVDTQVAASASAVEELPTRDLLARVARSNAVLAEGLVGGGKVES